MAAPRFRPHDRVRARTHTGSVVERIVTFYEAGADEVWLATPVEEGWLPQGLPWPVDRVEVIEQLSAAA